MKTLLAFSFVLGIVLSAGRVEAQPFALVDVSKASFGVEGGAGFGRGPIQLGFSTGVFLPYDLNTPKPDLEAYGMLSIETRNWFLVNFLGGGVTFGDDTIGSARAIIALIQKRSIAFRASVFAMVTPQTRSVFLQPRIGPSIQLGDTGARIFPYLALDVSAPGTEGRRIDFNVEPGATPFVNF